MKISQYTKFFIVHDECYIYNSLSNSLIKVDKTLFDKLKSLSPKEFSEQDLNENTETYNDLKNSFVIIEHSADDLLQYQAVTWERRKTIETYNITIAPTMDCNFRCYYCFENQENEYMSDDIIQRIVKYLKSCNCKNMHIVWFGGEPLLAIEQIRKITKNIKSAKYDSKNFCIITNGYYLTKDVVNELNDLQIDSIQLTVDGLYDDYNKVKCMKNDINCFDTFLKNLDYLMQHRGNIGIGIRVNMDKKITSKFIEIADFFIKRYAGQTITVSPAFLKNICETTPSGFACEFCNYTEKRQFYIDLFHQTGNKNYLYPENNFSECAIRNENSWAFGPDGSVYKCWENIGNKNTKIGYLNEKGEIVIENQARLLRYLYGADPLNNKDCRQCFYLPICYGGCPHQRILEEYENAPIEPCAKDNDYIERYLTEIINHKNNLK